MVSIKGLYSGYRSFFRRFFVVKRWVYHELVKNGQSPKALVIGCSDSRVDPALITRASPGDIFSVRNVANIVPSYDTSVNSNYSTGAAIEFAVKALDVAHIVVLGHSHCAGIKTLLQPKEERELKMVSNWVDIVDRARNETLAKPNLSKEEQWEHCSHHAMNVSLQHLKTYPFVKEKIDAGKLELHAWYFDLECGTLFNYNFKTKEFESLYI